MNALRILVLILAGVLSSSFLRADVNVSNNTPCTTLKVMIKQYIFTDGNLGSCPAWEASVAYGATLTITDYFQSWYAPDQWGNPQYHSYEVRYEAQYTYSVSAPPPTPTAPPSMGWGVFDVVCPAISATIISTSGPPWILGRTAGQLAYKCKPNIDCSGAFDSIGARVTITEYVYDSRINNSADIAAVSAAEAQHVQVWTTMINNIQSRTENGRREPSYAAATATTNDWETNVIMQELVAATNANAAYDQAGGPHKTLGNSIVSNGGFTP